MESTDKWHMMSAKKDYGTSENWGYDTLELLKDTLENLGHFATASSTLLRRYVMDIVTNLESLKHRIMGRGHFNKLELTLKARRP
jgi:hypothetical protein